MPLIGGMSQRMEQGHHTNGATNGFCFTMIIFSRAKDLKALIPLTAVQKGHVNHGLINYMVYSLGGIKSDNLMFFFFMVPPQLVTAVWGLFIQGWHQWL